MMTTLEDSARLGVCEVVALLALTLLVACTSEPPPPEVPTAEPPRDEATRVVEPQRLLPEILSTPEGHELNAVFSADDRELYFTRRVGEALKIFVTRRQTDGSWSPPRQIAPSRANSVWDEVDMWLADDDQTLYYISNQPTAGFAEGSVNIWRAFRQGDDWSDPEVLPAPVNTDAREIYPVIVDSGSLYFSSDREGGHGGRDLYVARPVEGGFTDVENLGPPVNTFTDEGDLYVAPDESYLIVTSRREDGLGEADLYLSRRNTDGTWSEARNLGAPINSPAIEYCPIVSPDGQRFFFSREGDVFWVDSSLLLDL